MRRALPVSTLLSMITMFTMFTPAVSQAQRVAPREAEATTPAQRTVLTRGWVGLWKVGSLPTDDLFFVPRELLATEQGVYVLDVGTLQLHAFDRGGRKRWTVGSKGQGPGQFQRPVDIAAGVGGDIAVLDPGNGRIAFFSASGEYRRSVASRDAVQATGVCITSDGRMQLWVDRPGPNIVILDRGGALHQSRTFPWPVPPDAPTLLRQAFFARGEVSSDCAFATLFGFGTGRVSPTAPASVTPYIEAVPMPTIVQERVKSGGARATITEGLNAATAAMRSGDTVLVQFHGASTLARAVLDLYGAGGGYLQSWRMPPCERVAYHSAVLYCMTNMAEEPTLVAFAAKADTARVLRGIRTGRR
ncbi:MAG: 6-bladed beta-propeller [Gemmatimonadota bacterium]